MSLTIVCFGDSNTFGLKPNPYPWTRQRWHPSERWPTLLSALVGFDVISEGLPGRTAASVNRGAPHLDALPYLPTMMESHSPIDVVIMMLGTNDLQHAFDLKPEAITISVAALAKSIARSEQANNRPAPKLLIMAPPPIQEVGFRRATFAGAAAKSRALAPLYSQMANELGFAFLDAGTHAKPSQIDGIHWDAADHKSMAQAVATKLAEF